MGTNFVRCRYGNTISHKMFGEGIHNTMDIRRFATCTGMGYLETKLKGFNNKLASYLKSINNGGNYDKLIYKIIRVLDETYNEINLYDRIYWCKFLGIFWLTISS